MASRHVPVLLEEVVRWLEPKAGSWVFDGTLGGGGHARGLLASAGGRLRLIAVDRDPAAWERSGLARDYPEAEIRFLHATFQEVLARFARGDEQGGPFDAMLLDLGLSSDQIDDPMRGFSFRQDGPLDMRMDPTAGEPASQWLEDQTEETLAGVLRKYGEVPRAASLARRILAARPIRTTRELAALCEQEVHRGGARGSRRGRSHHPATLVFQALRIAVNDELQSLEMALEDGIDCLATGGRLAVITFHSLEDRIVKQTFRRLENPCICPPDLPACGCGRRPLVRRLTRRAVAPSQRELAANPRARSARLRVVARLPGGH